jgi:hypothetical protein
VRNAVGGPKAREWDPCRVWILCVDVAKEKATSWKAFGSCRALQTLVDERRDVL